jgi:hypothetical protein
VEDEGAREDGAAEQAIAADECSASFRSCDTMSQLELSSSARKEDTRSSMEDHPFHRVSLPA